ncbi:hypothetical protein OEZ85_007247 [Tetradesmus obliquus]|uniref:Uncharacterized protein n=1 Tax=Tetradesmus obliquus TaxID=3088 RepID=A0ABY8TX09_TETOB|nr:hypothetical protein OEZ85_007247 [Tetradesmus obliquus]
MQPLAAWQAKLAELEVACRNAEALMLQAPTRAERSAALDLAVELREDIARIRQANRLQLKMQRSTLLRQGVPPAAVGVAATTPCAADGVNCSGKHAEMVAVVAYGSQPAVLSLRA